jgi:hypothetical protein
MMGREVHLPHIMAATCGPSHPPNARIIWESETASYASCLVNEQTSRFFRGPATEET